MHSIVNLCTLVGAPLAQTPASVRCGMDAISTAEVLLSLQLVCVLDRLFLIFLLKRYHKFSMGFSSGMLAGQSSTVVSWSANHLEVVLALWAGAKVLLKKVNQHLHKACQQMES